MPGPRLNGHLSFRLARADGPFSPGHYSPGARFAVSSLQTISRHAAIPTAHPPRINPVFFERFRPIKFLGEGGQVRFKN